MLGVVHFSSSSIACCTWAMAELGDETEADQPRFSTRQKFYSAKIPLWTGASSNLLAHFVPHWDAGLPLAPLLKIDSAKRRRWMRLCRQRPFCCFVHCCTLSSSVIRGMRDCGAIFFWQLQTFSDFASCWEKQQKHCWQAPDQGFVAWGRRSDVKRKKQQSR